MKKAKKYICLMLATMTVLFCSCSKNNGEQAMQTGAGVLEDDSVYNNLGEDTLWLSAWEFDTFNPLSTKSEAVADCAFLVYDSLFYIDSSLRAVPMLAKEYSISENGKRYTIKLNTDFEFHDGSEFSAWDVVYTVNEIKRLGALSLFIDNVSNIESATVVDSSTVAINIYTPESLFVNNLTFPVVKNKTSSESVITEPIGTGPYRFVKSNLVRAMYFEANESYPPGVAQIKNAVVNFIPERSGQTYALEARQSDAACVTSQELANYNPKGGVKTVYYNNRQLTFMGINSINDFLSFSSVRRSINAALDRKDIINTVLFGNAEPTLLPFPTDSFIYPAECKAVEKNTSSAVAELEAAGFVPGSDGVRVLEKEDGKKIRAEVDILVNSDNELRVQIAQKVSDTLKQIGIDARVVKTDFETYKLRIESGQYDMFVGEVKMEMSYMPTPLAGSSARYSIYSSNALDSANRGVRNAKNEQETAEAYKVLADCYMSEMPIICLHFGRDAMIVNSALDCGGYAVSGNEFSNLHMWKKNV